MSMYFEACVSDEVPNLCFGIGVASASSAVVYHATAGEILTSDQRISSEKPYGPKDTIGCRVNLNVYKSGNLSLHHCTFYLNGAMCSSTLYLEGCLPLSIVCLDALNPNEARPNNIFSLNMGDREFEYPPGESIQIIFLYGFD